MRLILGLIVAVFFLAGLVGCSSPSTDAGHGTLVVQFAPPAAKLGARAVGASAPVLPAELTRVIFEVRSENDELVTEGDWLKSGGSLEFDLSAGVPLKLVGTAYAGNEKLFSGSTTILPLRPGERRPIAILLAPDVKVLVSPSGSTGLTTAQSLVRINVGSIEPIQLTSNVTGLEDSRLHWFVNQIEGGNAAVGTIDSQGQYTPPAVLPEDAQVTLRAVPVAAPSFGSSLSIKLLPRIPAVPSALSAQAGDHVVNLSWQPSADAATYSIFRGETPGVPTGGTPWRFGLEGASFNDATAANGTTYYYVVTANNLGGASATSDEINAKPLPPLPVMPAGVQASAGVNQVTLSWPVVARADSYNIYRSRQANVTVSSTPLASLVADPEVATGSATQFVDTVAADGVAFNYVVIAVNLAGSSSPSAVASATPDFAPCVMDVGAWNSCNWQ